MRRGVMYGRYSSDMQREESIDAQFRAIQEYATAKGITIVAQYSDEAVSGKGSKTARRREYQRMLRDADKGLFDVILCHKYDRIARSLAEHVNLEKRLNDKGVELIATSQDFGNSKEGKIVRTLMWSLSEFYVDNLSDEVRKGHRENALKALHNGGVAPFGYDVVNKTYVVNEFEAHFVRRIFQAAKEREGYTAIIKEMDAIRGKRGKPLRYPQLYEILRNEKYCGVYTYSPQQEKNRADRRAKPNAIRIEDAFPAIISKEQFEEVQKIMDTRRQTGKKADYLCSGLVYCGSCGAKMHAHKSMRKGHEYFYYVCSAKCGAPVVHMEHVDAAATNYLRDILSPHNQEHIAAALRQYQAGEQGRAEDFNAIIKKIAEKERQYDALMGNLKAGTLPAEVVADIGVEMESIKAEIAALRDTAPPKDYTVDTVHAWLDSLKTAADSKAVHLLIERIDAKEKTDFNITSTLESVLGENGCGGGQHRAPTTAETVVGEIGCGRGI